MGFSRRHKKQQKSGEQADKASFKGQHASLPQTDTAPDV